MINQVLKAHPPMEKAWLFFNWASNLKRFKHDQYTYTTMMDIFGEAKRMSSMKYVFELMQQKGIRVDAVTYTSLMHWLSKNGDFEEAIRFWDEMREKGFEPTVVSYTAYMKVLFDDGRVKEAGDAYKEMIQSGIPPNCHTYTVLMEYLVGSGKYEEALEIFSKMQDTGVKPDKAACNILVEKCCKAGETRTMNRILEYMKENNLVLRYHVFMEALQSFKAAGKSSILLREVNLHISFEDNPIDQSIDNAAAKSFTLDTGLILLLLKKQNLLAVDNLLLGMTGNNTKLDSLTISTIIEVNCDRGRPDGALLALDYSIKLGIISLQRNAYLSLIGILIRSNMFEKVVEIVKEMVKVRYSLGIYTGALLIYRLGRARKPSDAANIFNLLPDDQKCISTYMALVSVYFSAGAADKAVKLFQRMQKNGNNPCLGTYNVLIAGLEKSSRPSEAETYRKAKRILQNDHCFPEIALFDQNICDLLFPGESVP
ncbi:pentatricopeptide repeat-containing protein At2g01390 [Rutidosis leptorrhynchoides]|uniref:pentatricopeptide repeat-containing protein At2g01390 n=1 Tax=Rutidosis leptorrhynchoides TaxID=125765 RepID=UPI003A9908A9